LRRRKRKSKFAERGCPDWCENIVQYKDVQTGWVSISGNRTQNRHSQFTHRMAATLIIQRSNEFLNRFRNIEILIDGKRAGKVANGSTVEFEVYPGEHAINARIDWASSNPANLHMAEGETYLLVLSGFRGSKWMIPVGLLLTFGTWALDHALDINISLAISIPILIGLLYMLTIGSKKYLTLTPISSNTGATH